MKNITHYLLIGIIVLFTACNSYQNQSNKTGAGLAKVAKKKEKAPPTEKQTSQKTTVKEKEIKEAKAEVNKERKGKFSNKASTKAMAKKAKAHQKGNKNNLVVNIDTIQKKISDSDIIKLDPRPIFLAHKEKGIVGSGNKFKKPFKNLEGKHETVSIPTDEDVLVKLTDGSTLEVPANAFVDHKGKVIEGKVELIYEPYNNAAEIIASGIPMTYHDEEGHTQQLESAGMFQLQGFAEGEEVNIAEGKSIEVNLKSDIKGDYQLFQMDPSTTNATGEGNGKWEMISTPAFEQPDDPNLFRLKFNKTLYNDLKPFDRKVWKLASKDPKKNIRSTKHNWLTTKTWTHLEVTKPRYESFSQTLPQESRSLYNEVHVSPDSQFIFTKANQSIFLWNWKGEKLKEFELMNDYETGIKVLENAPFFIISNGKSSHQVWTYEPKQIIHARGENVVIDEVNKRIIYIKNKDKLVFADFKGNSIKEIKLTSYVWSSDNIAYSKVHRLIAVPSSKAITIYNTRGEIIKVQNLPRTARLDFDMGKGIPVFFGNTRKELLVNTNVSLRLFDWVNDKVYDFEESIERPTHIYDKIVRASPIATVRKHFSFLNVSHPTLPLLIVFNTKNREWNIWNWEKQTLSFKTWQKGVASFSKNSNFIRVASQAPFEDRILDLNLNTIATLYRDADKLYFQFSHQITEDQKLILSAKDDTVTFFNLQGDVIKKVKTISSSPKIKLISPSEFLIFDSNQGITHYNSNGNVLKKIELDKRFSQLMANYKSEPQSTNFYTYNKYNTLRWNEAGELLNDYGKVGRFEIKNNREKKTIFTFNHYRENQPFTITDDTPVEITEDSIYQLNIYNEDTVFSTMVYLNSDEFKLIEAYKRNATMRWAQAIEKTEQQRKLIRSLKVRQFGIYNWDRFYKSDRSVPLVANFKFKEFSSLDDIQVFLITGENGRAIIDYPRFNWNKFSYIPEYNNQLVAVLPNNKVAIFTKEEFKKLQAYKLREEGKHTFIMNTSTTISSLEDFIDQL